MAENVFHSQPAGDDAMATASTATAEASELETTAATPTRTVKVVLGEKASRTTRPVSGADTLIAVGASAAAAAAAAPHTGLDANGPPADA